jgi:hypothetical protein
MTTGVDILRIFDREVDQAYTDFESTAQKTDRFKVAMVNIIERIYRGLDTQKDYDDIASLIVVDKYLSLSRGELILTPQYIQLVSFQTIPNITGTFITLTFSTPHGLENTDMGSLVFSNGINSGVSNIVWTSVSYSVQTPTTLTGYTPFVASGTYISNSVSVYSQIKTAANYVHLLAIKPIYKKRMLDAYSRIADVDGDKIKFVRQNSLRTGDVIRITTSPIIAGFEQDFYVKQLNRFTYEIYADSALTTTVLLPALPPTNNYNISVVVGDYAEKLSPHELVSRFSGRKPEFPGYLVSENKIVFRPIDPEPTNVYISYLKSDAVFFDLSSTAIDYETIYSRKFIQRVIDEAVADFNRSVRDYNALGAENNQIISNP